MKRTISTIAVLLLPLPVFGDAVARKLSAVQIQKLNWKAATELTIASGVVTISQSAHTVDGQGDADDELDTISGGVSGQFVVITPENAARNITLKHGTGNIVTATGSDYVIDDNGYVLLLYDGSNWRVLGTGGLTSLTVDGTSALNAGAAVKNGATGAGFVDIYEDSDDGTNKLTIRAQAMAGDLTYTLPPDDGDAGEQLQTDGSGNLTWESAGPGDMAQATWDGDTDGYIDADAGGTDIDTSLSTGVPSISAGTWSVAATLTHELGGLEADVSGYDGVVTISGGSTAAKSIGISDDNIIEIDDADAADNDYAKLTAAGVEGRSYAEVKTDLTLDSVENTALSTWAGTTNVTTLGTIGTGTWQGTAIADGYIASTFVKAGGTQALTADWDAGAYSITAHVDVDIEASTDTLTAAQCRGKVVSNDGAGGAVVYTLPSAVVGMSVCVVLYTAQDVDVNPDGTDQILGMTDGAGDAVSSDATVGSSLTLCCIKTGYWFALGYNGTWTDVD